MPKSRGPTSRCSPEEGGVAVRRTKLKGSLPALLFGLALLACAPPAIPEETPTQETGPRHYDLLIRNGTIYDGSGGPPFLGDVAVNGDTIAHVGPLPDATGRVEVDARGLAVAPGFVNMLSWATESLLEDGRSQSDIRQGVTLEVMGEGHSMGPLNEVMKKEMLESQGSIKYAIEWSTLGEYLEHLERRGISPNVASFVGATTVRIHVLGYQRRAPNREELHRMQALVRQAMEEGAMGVGSALIYVPGAYATTEELIAMAKVAAQYGGMYISHIRNEGERILGALDEFIRICRSASVRGEIYHLKVAGPANWGLLQQVIDKIEAAQREGLEITANMYTYTASASSLDVLLPQWIHAGGSKALLARLRDPAVQRRLRKQFSIIQPENIRPVNLRSPTFRPMSGKPLAEIASLLGKSPEEALIEILIQEGCGVKMIRFSISEENIRRQIALPWMSFGSDGGSFATEGVFLNFDTHPRAFGNFARLLGRYVRDEKIIPLEEAIRRLTSLPAGNLRLERRGSLREGFFADIVIFDPERIQDRATFEEPRQYATGVVHVFVNGVQVLKDGEHTGAKPGRVVRGPGWKRRS
jgi:N-acyl-D-amino-acid deacylase